jgi:hypothetical protein
MRYFAFSLILLFLALPCMAEHENVTTGPYNISFDLGIPKDEYEIEILDPEPQEDLSGDLSTKYTINITNGRNTRAFIWVIRYEGLLIPQTQSELIQATRDTLPDYLIDEKVVGRMIDGYPGAAASGRNFLSDQYIYYANYYLSSYQDIVQIMSKYPWEDGTLSLLRTIHIERNSTGST